ncbi:MAG TPA: type II secretion system F family protein [Ilumatobacter sp.]|nr:type II secretion system F family protein [Ilumatobacter sp.]
MTLASHTPLITFALVLAVGAALKPGPLPRTLYGTSRSDQPSRSVTGFPRVRWQLHRRPPTADAMAAAVWCDELARSLRSGSTLTAALRTSPTSPGIDSMVAGICLSLDRGRSTSEALAQATSSSPHVALALTVLRACADHGGPAAEPLDRAAATLRARAADRADRITQSAQARMSALVMTCLPAAMLALMLVTSGSVRNASASPLGVAAIIAGSFLNVLGWLWMRRTIEREAS